MAKKVRYFADFYNETTGNEKRVEIFHELVVGDRVHYIDEDIDEGRGFFEFDGIVEYRWYDADDHVFIFSVLDK